MTSLCVIGSVARNSADILSDQDILSVGDESSRCSLIEKFKRVGWNACHMTWEDFDDHARQGSLFIQHVKQDGKLIFDPRNELRRRLASFDMRTEYFSELLGCMSNYEILPNRYKTYWQKLGYLDCLYVLTRNLCILAQATYAKPIFDYEHSVDLTCNLLALPSTTSKTLKTLRSVKFSYRTRDDKVSIDCTKSFDDAFIDLCSGLREKIPAGIQPSQRGADYFRLRKLEIEVLSVVKPKELDDETANLQMQKFWKLVTKPSTYRDPRNPRIETWNLIVPSYIASKSNSL